MVIQSSTEASWSWIPSASTLLTIACVLAQASFGYDSTIGSIAPEEITFSFDYTLPLSYGQPQFGGGFTVTFGVGSVAGALLTILLGDLLGRKKSVVLGAAAVVLGALFQVTSNNSVLFAAGRVLSGLGSGFNSASAPMWQVEAAQTCTRGRLILLQITAKAVGAMVASWVALGYTPTGSYSYLDYNSSSDFISAVSWRFPVGMQLIMPSLLLLLVPKLPESPRWLLGKGKADEAARTVSKILNRPADDPSVQLFLFELSNPSEYGYQTPLQAFKKSILACCSRSRKNGRAPQRLKRWQRLAFGTILQFFSQWSGYAAFQSTFTSKNPAKFLQYASLTWYAVCAALSIALVEKLGRRRSLMTAFLGQALCGLIVASILQIKASGLHSSTAILTVCAIGQCFAGFNYGMPWLYQLEINSWAFRLVGTAVAQLVQYVASVLLTFTLGYSPNQEGMIYIGPILASTLATGTVFFLFPETTGRTPHDLDHYYSTAPSFWVWKQKAAIDVRARGIERGIDSVPEGVETGRAGVSPESSPKLASKSIITATSTDCTNAEPKLNG